MLSQSRGESLVRFGHKNHLVMFRKIMFLVKIQAHQSYRRLFCSAAAPGFVEDANIC